MARGTRRREVADGRSAGADEITIERGDLRDFAALERFHYRGERPGGVTAVWIARTTGRTVEQRHRALWRDAEGDEERGFENEEAPAGEIVGALVYGMPDLSCAARNVALGDRYAGLSAREAAVLINWEVRVIRRVVVDPRYRGLGIAVALVRRALEEAETPITEALAVMGRVHPFFERAGMRRVEGTSRPADDRLDDALWHVGVDASALRNGQAEAWRRLDGLDERAMAFVMDEIERWERSGGWGGRHGEKKAKTESAATFVDRVMDALGRAARPVYYVWEKPESRGRRVERREKPERDEG